MADHRYHSQQGNEDLRGRETGGSGSRVAGNKESGQDREQARSARDNRQAAGRPHRPADTNRSAQSAGRNARASSGKRSAAAEFSMKRWLMPLLLLAAVVVTVGIALAARRHSAAVRANTVADSATAASTETALEKNNYPMVNDLFNRYYTAMAAGDTDAISDMSAELSEEEKIRIGEISKYIDSYPSIDVYTKTGPVENSYVCYVVTTMKFKDHDWEVPGLQTMYVCTNDDGELYINNAHDQSQSVSDYIQTVSLQDDVVDLNNKVTADYNKLVADDADLSAFLNELSSNIDVSVGQALGQLQADNAATASTEADTASTEDTETSSSSGSFASGTTILTANDVVNVRNAAGEDADIIGTTIRGGQYQLIEQDSSTGWSQIEFNGTRGYVKTEFFTRSTVQ